MIKKDSDRWYIRTYASKVVLFVSLLIIVIIVVQNFVFIRTETAYLQDRLIEDQKSLNELLAINLGVAQTIAGFAFQSNLIKEAGEISDTVYVRFTKPNGEIYLSNIVEERGAVIKDPAINTDKTVVKDDVYKGESIKVVVSPVSGGYTVWLGFSLHSIHAAVNERVRDILLVSIVILIIGNFIAYFIAKRMTRPLKELRKGVEVISKGNLNYKVDVKTRDEVGQLASTFNQMVSDLRTSTTSIDNLNKEIAERQRMEEALRESEEKFSKAFRASPLAISINTLEDDRIIESNEGGHRISGYTREELIGRRAADLNMWVKAEERDRLIQTLREHGRVQNEEVHLRKKSGEIQVAQFSAEIISIGDKPCMISIINDITERKQTESKLKKALSDLEHSSAQLAATNKELEAFSYSVSHDLRAPLRTIDGFSQALLEDYPDALDKQGSDYLRRLRTASQKMGKIIDGLLKLSRLSRSDMNREKVDLSALAQEITENLRQTQPERQVEFVIGNGLTVKGDPQLLRAALENLLGNAWKFTGKLQQARIEFGATQNGDKRAYFVRDNGAGFDMTYADKLFGAFQRLHETTEFPGTGIGLATVQRIIHRHGGSVWAEGAAGEGATFYFTLS
jgi:PAS domain S-box-containing protein